MIVACEADRQGIRILVGDTIGNEAKAFQKGSARNREYGKSSLPCALW